MSEYDTVFDVTVEHDQWTGAFYIDVYPEPGNIMLGVGCAVNLATGMLKAAEHLDRLEREQDRMTNSALERVNVPQARYGAITALQRKLNEIESSISQRLLVEGNAFVVRTEEYTTLPNQGSVVPVWPSSVTVFDSSTGAWENIA